MKSLYESLSIPGLKSISGDVLFSFKTLLAAGIALYIAFSLNLPQAYWALVTVLIIAQPYSGMIRSKALYRVIGTIVGASFVVFIMPLLINSPELFSIAICLWIAICLFLSLYDGSPRSYGFILGGYTSALIGFPAVDSPGTIFLLARSRVEEVVLGVLTTFLVNELFFPRQVTPLLLSRMDKWLSHVAKWGGEEVSGRGMTPGVPHSLGAEISTMSAMGIHAAYESPDPRVSGWLEALMSRMRDLLPVFVDLNIHRKALSRLSPALSADLDILGGEIDGWMSGKHHHSAKEMEQVVSRWFDEHGIPFGLLKGGTIPTELGSLMERLARRFHELVVIWGDCRRMRQRISHGGVEDPPSPKGRVSVFRDPLLPFLSALAVSLAVGLSIFIWRALDWPEGFAAAMMAAVSGTFFAAMDDPSGAILDFLAKINIGSVAGLITLFFFLPQVHDFAGLMVVMGIVLIPAGIVLARPDGPLKVLPFMIGFSGLIALQSTYHADFSHAWNTAISEAVGVFLAALSTILVRSVGVTFSIRRILSSIHLEIVQLASLQGQMDRSVFVDRMFDRIAPLMSRMGVLGMDERKNHPDGLYDMVVGLDLIRLGAIREKLPPEMGDSISRLTLAIGNYYDRPGQSGKKILKSLFDEVWLKVVDSSDLDLESETLSLLASLRWTLDGGGFMASSDGRVR